MPSFSRTITATVREFIVTMAAAATRTRAVSSRASLPLVFQGDGEGMVDLLIDACIHAKETTLEAAASSGSSAPRAGRDLVPYFNPGSTDWGLEDVNEKTDDCDSSDGSLRLVQALIFSYGFWWGFWSHLPLLSLFALNVERPARVGSSGWLIFSFASR